MIRVLLVLFLLRCTAAAQPKQGQARLDSFLAEAPKMREDTSGVWLMNAISALYNGINPDDGLIWAARGLALSKKLGWRKGESLAYMESGNNYNAKSAYPEALDAYFKALRMAEGENDNERIGSYSGNIGTVYTRLKDYATALQYQFKALKIAEERRDRRRAMNSLGNIGGIYNLQKDYPKALEYLKKALALADELNDKSAIVVWSGNVGSTYTGMKQYNAGIAYQFRSLRMATEIGARQYIAVNLGNIGTNYTNIGTDSTAEPVADSLVPATRAENLAKGIEYLRKGLAGSRQADNKQNAQLVLKNLAENYAKQGDYKSALQTFKEYIALRDTVFNADNDKKLLTTALNYTAQKTQDSIRAESEKRTLALQKEAALATLRYEYERKQAAAKTEGERRKYQYEEGLKRAQIMQEQAYTAAYIESKRQREAAIAGAEADKRADIAAAELKRRKSLVHASYAGGALLLIGAVVAILAYRSKRKAAGIIAAERERSEALLRNILPAEVAQELKTEGAAATRQYDEVSVLFTDFVNFSGASERLSPQALVQELHECFSAFDAIIERHSLEKIKTIGDAYMAVCGLPQANMRHAQACVAAAIEIRDFMDARKSFGIRIGIHSGPVVAGIVGMMKYAYDVWGDTVTTAAEMEQRGEPGRINISAATYALVQHGYLCISRGEVWAANKRDVAMYFVESPVSQKARQNS